MEKTDEYRKAWVAELNDKYTVKIYEDNLRNCMPFIKEEPPAENANPVQPQGDSKMMDPKTGNPHTGAKPVNPHQGMEKKDKSSSSTTTKEKKKSE